MAQETWDGEGSEVDPVGWGGSKQRMQGAREGMVSEEVAGESVGTPTLTATGNPSDGEMGQLLTREIKSHGDGEYLYAHLLTQREDAPSWTTVELHFLAPNRAAFPGGGGGGAVALWGQ